MQKSILDDKRLLAVDDEPDVLETLEEQLEEFEGMVFDKAMLASNMATCNEEDIKYLEHLTKSTQGPGFLLIIAGNSPGEFEYKQRALQLIIDETSGKSTEMIEDPKIGGGTLWRCIRITASIRETFRATGVFGGAQAGNEGLDSMFEYIRKVGKIWFKQYRNELRKLKFNIYCHKVFLLIFYETNKNTKERVSYIVSYFKVRILNDIEIIKRGKNI